MPNIEFKVENGHVYAKSEFSCTLPTFENEMPVEQIKPFSTEKKLWLIIDVVVMSLDCFMVYFISNTILRNISRDINHALAYDLTFLFAFIFLTLYMLFAFIHQYKQGE